MKRISLFIVTNFAALLLLSVVVFVIEQVFGVRLAQGGMSRSQAEAVLGHEISHVANGDMVTLGLLQGVLNTFVIFLARVIGTLVDRAVFKDDRDGALKRSQGEPLPAQTQAFGINTGNAGGFMRFFITHPPLDARIAALRA